MELINKMKKKIVRHPAKHHRSPAKKIGKTWRILWISTGFFAFLLVTLVGSALFVAHRTSVLGAQIAMVYNDGGSNPAPTKKLANVGQQCGVNSDCAGGGKTTYCSRYGKCTKYCTQITKSNVCYGKYLCTAVYNKNKTCGATDHKNCKHVNYRCGYVAPTPTPVKCTSNSQCSSSEVCCTGNNIGSVACRGYANNTCQYAQCIGTFTDGYCNPNGNHTSERHGVINHYCQVYYKCNVGDKCGATCDATHHCANGKTCNSSCQCQ